MFTEEVNAFQNIKPDKIKTGYSTAPEWVRELGFGAGMGLCNISRCATKMDLKSTVGKGTQLNIRISIDNEAKSENS